MPVERKQPLPSTLTSDLANYDASSSIFANEPAGKYRRETTPVGQFPPNGFGLYDMHGNVWEWCEDDFRENYQETPSDGSAWQKKTKKQQNQANKVLRCGYWGSNPDYCRSAYRNGFYRRDDFNSNYGFRLVCEVGRTL